MRLGRFARVPLTHGPTPLEPMLRLSKRLGGPNLFVKRDDCTGLASGGNKTRKLEFLMAEALAQGATHIVTQGATQSNHVRQTAAAAARFGLKCTALLEERVSGAETAYYNNGNVLLDQLFGCEVLHRPGTGLDMNGEMVPVAEALRAKGEVPYLIPGGGSNALGALGYVVCAQEIVAQADAMGIVFDHVVTATGSAGTHAGLVAGLAGMNSGIPVLGVGVRAPRDKQEANVHRLGEAVWQLLGLPGSLPRESIVANCDYVGPGYGQATPGMIEAVRLLAQQEGLLLDPVYSGKAMAGLIDLIRQGHFKSRQNVLFLHTGGSVGLFGYQQVLQA